MRASSEEKRKYNGPVRMRRLGALLSAVIFGLALAAGAVPQKKHPPAKPLDLNAATAEQLSQVPGIGPSIAKEIVAFREKSGPFRRVEDLLALRRITRRTLEKIRPYVTVESKK